MTLKRGMSGEAVKQLQLALRKYDDYMFGDLVADGVYGIGTENAVKNFQQMKKLAVDGVAGPATLSALGLSTATSTTNTSSNNFTPVSATGESSLLAKVQAMFTNIPKPVLYGSIGVVVIGAVILIQRRRTA